MKEYIDYSLLHNNTFGIDAKTDRFVEYESEEELVSFLSAIGYNATSLLHIGGGSNLLFTKDFQGTVLHSLIKGIDEVKHTDESVCLRVGAGVVWDDFVAYCVGHRLFGAENLSFIPGEVGASAVQNIGAYGAEAKDIIDSVEAVEIATGKKRVFACCECDYSYRSSIFKHELKGKYIITYVTYRLSKIESFDLDYGNVRKEIEKEKCGITLENVRDIIIKIRKEKLPDPKVLGNAGSYFMNPVVDGDKFSALIEAYPSMPHYKLDSGKVKIPAAWLIDQCGFKGLRRGNAGVHHIQPLVLVNCGNASANEIIELANSIIESIFNKFQIRISPEVNYI